MGVGFSLRLFGAPVAEANDITRAAYAALEDVLRALEDMGFEVTRDGNRWQPGRLVLGWAAFVRAYDTELLRFCDMHPVHGANVERSERLRRERAAMDEAAQEQASTPAPVKTVTPTAPPTKGTSR